MGDTWVHAEDLQVGDLISGELGGNVPVVSVAQVDFGVRGVFLPDPWGRTGRGKKVGRSRQG